ncbi:MarR family transcriptional regulator, partial [Salmonella enterica subsp. enterica]|nr:MarR family transcriptional regulator [Salmonella enterica subsp. enterica serovar Enteritidis]
AFRGFDKKEKKLLARLLSRVEANLVGAIDFDEADAEIDADEE